MLLCFDRRPAWQKSPPKAVVPHQSGYRRLALNTEVRDDVFENARADALRPARVECVTELFPAESGGARSEIAIGAM